MNRKIDIFFLVKMLNMWGPFYKNIWQLVLEYLPQTSWHVMLVNRTFRDLIYSLDAADDKKIEDKYLISTGRIRTFMHRGYFNKSTVYWLARCGYVKVLRGIRGYENEIYVGASRGGNAELIKTLPNTYTIELAYAAKGGHEHIIDMFLEKNVGGSHGLYFQSACHGGNINIINKIIKLGNQNWDGGLYGACQGGHVDLVEMMIKLGATDLNGGLEFACGKGRLNIVKMLMHRGAKVYDTYIYKAFKRGNLDLIKFLVEHFILDWDECLLSACRGKGNIDAIRMCVEHGATNFNEALELAGLKAGIDIIEYLISIGANNWNGCLFKACAGGRTYVIQRMIDLGATDWNAGLSGAYRDYPHIVNWMIRLGATKCINCEYLAIFHVEEETKYKPQN